MTTAAHDSTSQARILDLWPLSGLQQGMLFHSIWEDETGHEPSYQLQFSVELSGTVSSELLAASVAELFKRHENLRVGFFHTGRDEPVQFVPESITPAISEIDLSAFEGSFEDQIHEHAAAEWRRGFDLSAPPLLRVLLMRLSPERSVLLVTAHHLLLDGWSIPLLLTELLHGIAGQPIEEPASDYLSYLDYLDEVDVDAALAAVVATLDGVSDATIVADGAAVGATTEANRPTAEQRVIALGAERSAAIDTLARQLDVTPASLVYAMWGLFLGHIVDRDDVTFGATVSGRSIDVDGVESIIGLLSNTIPLRVTASASASIATVIRDTHQRQGALIGVSSAELGAVQTAIGFAPLFDTLVVVENYPGGVDDWASRDGSLRVTAKHSRDAVHYPLSLLAELGENGHLTLTLQPEAFRWSTADALSASFDRLVEQVLSTPHALVAELSLASPEEQEQLTDLLDGREPRHGVVAYPQPSLDALMTRVRESHGEATALIDGKRRLTFAEVHTRAEQIAAMLSHDAVNNQAESAEGSDHEVIAVLADRSAELPIAVLGVLKAGAAFLALDPEQPMHRLAAMLEDARSPRLIATAEQAELARQLNPAALVLDPIDETIESRERVISTKVSAAHTRRQSASAAYVVFTSGTTGRPKGCVVPEAALVNRLLWMAERYRIGPADTLLLKTPVSFDVSVWELLLPFVTGSALTIAAPGAHRDPEALDALIARDGVTTVHFVPSMLSAYLDLVPEPRWSTVKRVICSGEALPRPLAHAVHARTGAAVHNLYGPAEAAIDVTAGDHAEREAQDSLTASLGSPVPHTSLRVLDSALRAVSLGQTGELYLAGVQLAQGYISRAGLTAERFVADPNAVGERMYRTGDRVTVTETGLIYRGRADDQLKLRGVRIEIAEIEAALLSCPGVVAAAARLAAASESASAAIIGYVQLAPDAELASIRAALAENLPEIMIPSRLVVVEGFATTANGKLDRAALATVNAGDETAPAGRAPSGEREELMATIARELLGTPSIGAEHDLFAAGLDSISAIRFCAQLRSAGWNISLRELFALRTLESVAAAATAIVKNDDTARGSLLDLSAAQRDRIEQLSPDYEQVLPLGPLQHGLYFHTQLGSNANGLDVYLVQHKLTLQSEVNVRALQAAGDALLRRHPSLRAGFAHEGLGEPLAFIAASQAMPLRELDLSGLSAVEQAEELEKLTEQQVIEGFDLAAPPLIRMVLVRLGPAHYLVSLVHHHILTDGWSQTILLEDLFTLYGAALTGGVEAVNESSVLPPTADYSEYLAWVAQQDRDEAMHLWRERLAGLSGPTLVEPASLSTPPVLSESVAFGLSLAESAALKTLARTASVTLSTVLSYAWAHVLRSITGSDDIVFGTTVSGRPAELENVERMVGLLMNTIPVRITIRPEQSLAAQLAEVMAGQADVMPAHHLELGYVQQAAGHQALFDTLYVLRNLPVDEDEQNSTFSQHKISEAEAYDGTHYSLAMTVNPGETLEVALAYRPDLVSSRQAGYYLARYRRVLATMLEGAEQPAGRLDTALQIERPLIDRVNNEATQLPISARADAASDWRSIDSFLSDAAERYPERTALVGRSLDGAELALSFAEVERRVSRTAKLIAERTSTTEAVVALALPRTVEHVIAIFATLRAGRAYLPLDLASPEGRLRTMLERSEAELLLTTSSAAERIGESAAQLLLESDPELRSALAGLGDEPQHSAHRTLPDQAAYVIFTSGSTGEPKAVVVPHRGLVTMYENHLEAIFRPALARAGRERFTVAHTVSFSFDMSWEEFFWLLGGHEVHIIDEERRLDVPQLVQHYAEIGVDVINVTPSYGRELIRAGLFDTQPPALMLLGGEAIPPELWQLISEHPHVSGYDLYGPTEFTINALGIDLAPGTKAALGRPILRARAYVLDSALAEVAPGASGELYLGGDGLTRGYHSAAALTAACFIADPFGPAGSRLYRTGDLVHRRWDGGIEYRGRNDDQIKVRGYRIELAEIEAAAERHPAVVQACASVQRAAGGAEALALHLVVADGAHRDSVVAELRESLAQSLPPYAVPRLLAIIEAIPLTVNGKCDRAALPAIASETRSSAPIGRIEHEICRIFSAVLGIEVKGREDNFFDLGGHSLLAMRVVAAIGEDLGVNVAVGTVMAAPTAQALATAIAEPSRAAGLAPLLTLRAVSSQHPVFCVHPAGGFAWQFAPFVQHLPREIGVLGLQAQGLSAQESTAATIVELAAEYLERMKSVQPHGPYRIVGYSFGGNIAHEIAAQLAASGETVQLLALIDPAPLTASGDLLDGNEQAALRHEQSEFIAQLSELGEASENAEALESIRASRGVLGRIDEDVVEAIVRSHSWSSRLMATSRSPRTKVPTQLFVGTADEGEHSAVESWASYLGPDLRSFALPFDHYAMVSQEAWATIGAEIAHALQQSESQR